MRVLFSSTWGVGHVFPMVPLARAFIAAGHQVLWVTHEPARPVVQAAGIDVQAAGLSAEQVHAVVGRMRDLTAPLPPAERAGVAFRAMFGAWATPPMLADLLPIAGGWGPDLLIHEPAELAAPLVAALLGVPCVTHSWGPAIPAEILRAAAHELTGLWAAHDRAVPQFAGLFQAGYLDLCPPAVQYIPIDHIGQRIPLRPVPYGGEETGPAIQDLAPADGRPLIYITLGTVFTDTTLLQGTVDAAAAVGARVVATVGPHADPALISRPSNAVEVHRWVSQTSLFAHAALVVSHAGSGTFLGALSAGLPQLCLPQAADQFRNATAAVRSGAGLALTPDQVTPDALDRAIQGLLRDTTYRAAATRVATEIAAMPDPSTVVTTLVDRIR